MVGTPRIGKLVYWSEGQEEKVHILSILRFLCAQHYIYICGFSLWFQNQHKELKKGQKRNLKRNEGVETCSQAGTGSSAELTH